MFAGAEHFERHGDVVRVVLDRGDRHTGGNPAHHRHMAGLGAFVVGGGCGLRNRDRFGFAAAAFDDAR